MTAISKAWVTIADSAVDPDSPLDATLMTGMRDDLVHLREWLGASFFAGAVQDHNHDGLNSASLSGAVGFVQPWPGFALPSASYDWCDGGTLNRVSFATCKNLLMKEATVTVTIASPAVFTWVGHGLRTNLPIKFFTSGALPTGITAGTHGGPGLVGTNYYVKVIDANTFNIAATPGGANINTSGTQSGVHTGTVAPHGDGDGSTTFHKPDLRGRVPAGRDDMGGVAANRLTSAALGVNTTVLGAAGGAETVTLSSGQVPVMTPGQSPGSVVSKDTATTAFIPTASGKTPANANPNQSNFNGSIGGGGAHLNAQPFGIIDWIIRIS